MAYIDPITGAYVADSLDALPPGYNQHKVGNEANVAKMRAALNGGWDDNTPIPDIPQRQSTDPFNLVKQAYQHMPGASMVQGVMPALLSVPQFLASLGYGLGNQVVNPEIANFNKDTTKAMQAMQYTPPTQAGRDIAEGIGRVGEATGPLPELFGLPTGRRFTPDDLRVAGKMATEDFHNFGSDYANAKAGVQHEYPTAGSRAAQFTDVAGDMVRPFAEKAYDMYMNPRDTESFSINPVSNLSGLAPAGGPMYAVKPKGGNWPTNLGATMPLSEQGELGKHLSSVQYDDPMAVFKQQLEKHYPRAIDNRELLHKWEDFWVNYLAPYKEFGSPPIDLDQMQQFRKEAANQFAENYNIEVDEAAGGKPLYTASEIEQALPAYNAWVMGPYQKYITNQMGTGLATDPLLQAVNESGMPVHEIFGLSRPVPDYRERTGQERREDFIKALTNYGLDEDKVKALENTPIGKITATTPEGLQYENVLDAQLYPKGRYSFTAKEGYPVSEKLDRKALITDFLTKPDEETGFNQIRKQIFQDLLAGNLDPNKLSNVTPATVTRQMIKDKMAEFKAAQLSKQGAAEWIPKRAAAMPTDMAFFDGSKMTIITPEMAKADEAMTARDLGQITIDLNQCVGAGCHATQDYPGHGPFLVPHTGKPPRGKVDYDKYGYLRRLKNGDIEIASLKDPNGVSQATLELKLEKLGLRDKEKAIIDWFKNNNMLDQKTEFTDNTINFGLEEAVRNAFQLYPELKDLILSSKQKSIQQIKGANNGDVNEAYVPQMLEWLNKNAPNLTDVRELSHLKSVHDLDNHYNSIGKMTDERPHWYSPTVEDFFQKAEDEKLLPRFFTTDQFGDLATQHGVDLSAEPPKKLSDWDKQTLREEVYSVLIKDPESLYLQDNLKDDYVQNLDILFGDRKPKGQVPLDVHRKLADMLLDHNGKYREQLVSALGQLADKGPNGWVNNFTEPQITNMLDIMAGWFQKHPFEKLPTNADLERAVQEHPDPFSEIQIAESPWHPIEPENAGEFDQVTAIRQRAYENASEMVRELHTDTFLRRLYEGDMDARQSIATDMESFPQNYGLTNYSPAARNAVIERVMQEGIFWPHENPREE
jgi:hypothetical protein